MCKLEPKDLADQIIDVLDEKQGADIHLLDISELSVIADYFVICSGSSSRLVRALVNSVVEEIKDQFGLIPSLEGEPEYGWMLADYGSVILHVFSPERRNYYQLEELWSEGQTVLRLQ
jgi:ribosome-associated protein